MNSTNNEDEELQEKQPFMQKIFLVISIILFGVLGILALIIVYLSFKDLKDENTSELDKYRALRDINKYAREGVGRLGALGYEAANQAINVTDKL